MNSDKSHSLGIYWNIVKILVGGIGVWLLLAGVVPTAVKSVDDANFAAEARAVQAAQLAGLPLSDYEAKNARTDNLPSLSAPTGRSTSDAVAAAQTMSSFYSNYAAQQVAILLLAVTGISASFIIGLNGINGIVKHATAKD